MAGALFGGRFEMGTLLGSGGMARVHRAYDTRLGRTVAVKTLLPELARDPNARHRFAREARAAAALNHPGIVTVHDQDEISDEDGIVPYLVMEFIDGGTLEDILHGGAPLDVEQAVKITCDVLDALAHAHAHGTVHRDVKPANVMITRSGTVKVADFGIARVVDAVTRITGTGLTVGTPSYMSPEQVLGKPVDARGDVYAVGCLLTELLTGAVPFTGNTPLNIMYCHVHQAPPAPSERNQQVPPELDVIVLKALAKAPGDRQHDAAAMRDALRGWLEQRAGRAPGQRSYAGESGADGTGDQPPTPASDGGSAPVVAGAAAGTAGDGAAGTGAVKDGPVAGRDPEGPADGPGKDPGKDSGQDPGKGGELGKAADAGTAGEGSQGSTGHVDSEQRPGAGDPRSSLSLLKGAEPDGGRAVPMPPPPSSMPAHQPPGYSYPVLGGHSYDPVSYAPAPNNPYATPAYAPPGHPPPGATSLPAPGSRPRGKRALLVAAIAAAVAGVLVAVAVLTDPFGGGDGGDGRRKDIFESRKEAHGYNGALTGAVNPSRTKGGTLKLASAYGPDSLDPVRSYTTMAWNLQRIYLRKLVDYAPAPGDAGRKLVGDLATSTGKVSDGGRTYTYRLREGVTFEDGTSITSKDVKYGIERSFARDLYGTGPSHLVDLLDQGQGYKGPYQDTDPDKLGLKSVSTPDDRTVVFHLADPFPDFPYVLAMSIASPVPQAKDTKEAYERHPVASGPYKVSGDYNTASSTSLTLVRNTSWHADTDRVRTALPDRIELSVMNDQSAVDQALLAGTADLDAAQIGMGEASQVTVTNDGKLKDQADAPYSGAVRYFSIQTMVEPFDDYHCRRAVQYAVDKPALRAAFGGDQAGDIASVMLPPTIGGHNKRSDAYGTKAGPQVLEAKRELRECGQKDGFSVKLVSLDANSQYREVLQLTKEELGRVGIKAEIETVKAADYFRILGDREQLKKKRWGIALTSWASDWPAPAGFLRPLVTKDSEHNYAGLDDYAITALVKEAAKEKDQREVEGIWEDIDDKLMNQSVVVPLVHTRQFNFRGPRLTNAYIHPALGGIDLQALGVSEAD